MSLFVLASKDGWVDIMYDGLDAVGVDQQVGLKRRGPIFGAEVAQHGPPPGMTGAGAGQKEGKAGWGNAVKEALTLTAGAVTGSRRAKSRHVLLALQNV